jgi:hypothetical protein
VKINQHSTLSRPLYIEVFDLIIVSSGHDTPQVAEEHTARSTEDGKIDGSDDEIGGDDVWFRGA